MTRELRCDFDGPLPRQWEQRLAWTLWQVRRRAAAWWVRRTRHGWHVGVALTRPCGDWEAIALQAALGSDFRREVFNVAKRRQRQTNPERWNVLYTRKIEVVL